MKFLSIIFYTILSASAVTYKWSAADSLNELNSYFGHSHTSVESFFYGALCEAESTFDTVTEVFTWNATFGPIAMRTGSTPAGAMPDGNRNVDAYSLVVNSGWGVPTGAIDNFVAQINVDFVDITSPNVTVYSYTPGGTAFDGTLLAATNDPNINLFVADLGNNKTRVELSIDLTQINDANLTPIYNNNPLEWRGIEYYDEIGMWFHMYTGIQTAYDANGGLTQFDMAAGGLSDAHWLDFDTLSTTRIPEPSSFLLIALAGFGLAANRRRS